MRFPAWLVVAMGCYSPVVSTGSPCTDSDQCPDGQVCSPATDTCELSAIDAPNSSSSDAFDGECGVTGNPPCPPNDRPSGATDVTMGGVFDADFTYAHADD
ncbi:MAG TPA: hypothetical protein VGO00_04590, partial [Kofleriaceae bacterium]|nr:hypothetical protein [Kofleriaceae bacterium]